MPVYPCAKCNSPVDPTQDGFCRNCSDKTPFSCSACNKRMPNTDIFQLEKLQIKKPLLCMTCGEAGEVVKCGICKLTLVRSSGKSLSSAPGARVYHTYCFSKQMKTVEYIGRLVPLVAFLGLLMGWLIGQTIGNGNMASATVGAIGAAVGLAILTLAVKTFFTPK